MFDVEMLQVIHRDLPDELVPTLPVVKAYLFDRLPNHGEGGPGEYTYWGDDDARESLDEHLSAFIDDRREAVDAGVTTLAEAEAAIRQMRNWVQSMKTREDAFDIIFYRS